MSEPPCPVRHGGSDITRADARGAPERPGSAGGKPERRSRALVACRVVRHALDESLFTVKLKFNAFNTSLMSVLVIFFC